MKKIGLIYKIILSCLTVFLVIVDIFLMSIYGFKHQLIIFLYILIGVVPLCGVVALSNNLFMPAITINYDTETIIADFIANEFYKYNKHQINQGAIIYFNELINCEVENKKIIFTLKYGHTKTLYLNAFTKKQITQIKNEIDKIIS